MNASFGIFSTSEFQHMEKMQDPSFSRCFKKRKLSFETLIEDIERCNIEEMGV